MMELMSYGEELTIIEPQWLIDDIKQRLLNTFKRYETIKNP